MFGSSNDVLSPCTYLVNEDDAWRLLHYRNIIGGLSMFSSFLSIIGSSSIIWYSASRRVCRFPEVRPLFHLSAADLILSLLWFISSCVYFATKHSINRTAVTCFILQTMTEIVHVITFFLTMNYAANVYLCMRERALRLDDLESPSLVFRVCNGKWIGPISCALAWIVPILIFIPFISHMGSRYIDSCQSCLMLIDVPRPKGVSNIWQYYGYLIMVMTLSVAIVSILVLYALTMIIYRRSVPVNFLTDRERVMIHRLTQSTLKFIIVFLVCWSPALTIASMDLQTVAYDKIDFEPLDRYMVLYTLQALTAPLQGFLNSLVYGWGRKTFRQIVIETAPSGVDVHHTEDSWPSETQQMLTH